MVDKSKIEKIINEKILKIKDVSKGYDHKVYIVRLQDKEVVLRIPIKEKNKIVAQAWAMKRWKRIGVPVPEILSVKRDYIIEERIDGTDLEGTRITNKQKQQVLFKLGKYLKRMHTIKTKKYGYLLKPGIGGKRSWKDFIEPDFKGSLKDIKTIISADLANKTKEFFDKNKDILKIKTPRLIHADLAPDNIMIKDGKLNGLIDASDSMSGDPYYDLGIINYFFRDYLDYFMKGYGKIDLRKVNFYSVYDAVWLINFYGLIHKNKKAFRKAVSSLKHFLSAP